MTLKQFGTELLKMIINTVLSLVVLLIIFGLGKADAGEISLSKKIEQKADVKYVDKQDAAIKQTFTDYKLDHTQLHSNQTELLRSMDRKLEILLNNQ